MATWNALTDPLPRWDPKSQELAYNNYTDRMKIELPEPGDPAASGSLMVQFAPGVFTIDKGTSSISVWSASGTADLPVYVQNPVTVEVRMDDTVKVISASGTSSLPVYMVSPIEVDVRMDDTVKVISSSGTAVIPVYLDRGSSSVSVWSASGNPSVDVHLTDVAYKEDGPHTTTDWGVPALAVRNDSIGSLVGTDRDYANIQLSQYGGVRTQLDTVRDVSIDIGNGYADTGTIRVAVASGVLKEFNDSIRAYSASGTADISTYIQNEVRANVTGRVDADVSYTDDSIMVYSASGTTSIPVYMTNAVPIIVDIGDEIKIKSASGTSDIPVYIQNDIEATNFDIRDLDETRDNIRVYSASGTIAVPIWDGGNVITVDGTVSTVSSSPTSNVLVNKKFTYNALGDILTIKESDAASPSGALCKLQTFTYNADDDVDYIFESWSTW